MVKRQKTEIIAAKRQKDRGRISLFCQKNKNDSNKSNIDLNQKDNLNPAFLWLC